MGFWDKVLEGLKTVKVWEDDIFPNQSIGEIGMYLREKVENATKKEENSKEE